MSIADQAYTPGVCNINRAEIAHRRNAGYFGLVLSIIIAAVLYGFPLPRWSRLVLFIPVFIAAIGFLQARNHFCVAYAASGMQHAGSNDKEAQKVVDEVYQKADRRRARQINLQSIGVTVVIVVVALLLP